MALAPGVQTALDAWNKAAETEQVANRRVAVAAGLFFTGRVAATAMDAAWAAYLKSYRKDGAA